MCCNPWGCKELDTTEQLNWTECKTESGPWYPSSILCGPAHLCSSPFAPFLGVFIKLSLPLVCCLIIYPYGFTLTGLWTNWGQENSFIISVSSVAQWCLTLCYPMDCSMPGFSVYHQLPELAQTHVHWVSDAIQPWTLGKNNVISFNYSQHVVVVI